LQQMQARCRQKAAEFPLEKMIENYVTLYSTL